MTLFHEYVAVGDSMSIDLYPALDAGETSVAVALERVATAGDVAPLGAASLLHTNADERWPAFAGMDLVSEHPGVGFRNLAQDGATIGDVFGDQLPELAGSDEPTLITLTVGGNDLLSAYASDGGGRILQQAVRAISEAYDYVAATIAERYPRGVLVFTTVYDPSDRTGRIPGVFEGEALPLKYLDQLNEHIRTVARQTPRARLADVYGHFLGRGATAPESDRWYWRRSMIEPNAEGASEIRRVWWEALQAFSTAGPGGVRQ